MFKSQWESYKTILPKDADKVQLRETERAFYAGALALADVITSLNNSVDPHNITPYDVHMFRSLRQELEEFRQLAIAGIK